jgi:hypothetical protein
LSERDTEITKRIKSLGIDFLATRFKDDYRILSHSKEDSDKIIKVIIDVLNEFNLQVNESKTKVVDLLEGLYRLHSLKYEPFSLRNKYEKKIPFKIFEYTLLKSIEIHREHLGTSILEKFLSELIDVDKDKKIEERLIVELISENNPKEADNDEKVRKKNIKKMISLLLMLKNESSKSLGKVLSVIECLWSDPANNWMKDEDYLFNILKGEIEKALLKSSAFELIWLLYFSCRHKVEIDLPRLIKQMHKEGKIKESLSELDVLKNPFVATFRNKMPNYGAFSNPFGDDSIAFSMFTKPEDLGDYYLVDYLDVFNRAEPEN